MSELVWNTCIVSTVKFLYLDPVLLVLALDLCPFTKQKVVISDIQQHTELTGMLVN